MKYGLSVVLILCLFGNSYADKINKSAFLILSQDSGYVTKQEGLPFLLSASLTDTLDGSWGSWIQESDTIGKYYKMHNNHFMVCLVDVSGKYDFETHLLIELGSDGGIIKSERFFHGNYPCCWNNLYDGFYKSGDWFCIKTCGTGSGFCSTSLYLFKKLLSQDEQNPVFKDAFFSYSDGEGENIVLYYTSVSSVIVFENDDQIIVHYEREGGTLIETGGIFETSPETKEQCNARFIFENNRWMVEDKNCLQNMEIF